VTVKSLSAGQRLSNVDDNWDREWQNQRKSKWDWLLQDDSTLDSFLYICIYDLWHLCYALRMTNLTLSWSSSGGKPMDAVLIKMAPSKHHHILIHVHQ
jgi:hypothetical protein